MSVSGYMYNVNATRKLGEVELHEGLEGNRSWHHHYRNSAYIYVGGLHPGLTEGDFVIVFSQFGEIVDVHLVRDKVTGKSKGFGYICYEVHPENDLQDQRSTTLAVDNMNGFQLFHKSLRVDHCEKFKAPKKFSETEVDEDGDPKLLEYKATGAEGAGRGMYNVIGSQQKIAELQVAKQKPTATAKEDEDEAWAKEFEDGLHKEQRHNEERSKIKDAKKQIKEMKKETKRLKKQAKQVKKAKKKSKKEKVDKEARRVKRKRCGSSEEESSVSGPSDESQDTSDS